MKVKKNVVKLVILIFAFLIVLIVPSVVIPNVVKSSVIEYVESPSDWRECYSVCVLYADNKYTKYNTSGYYYNAIYIRFDEYNYYLKLIDKDGKEEILQGDRSVQCLVVNYK